MIEEYKISIRRFFYLHIRRKPKLYEWMTSSVYRVYTADRYRLSEWMMPNGNYIPIKRMTKTELQYAIRLIEFKQYHAGQHSKIISLRKELARRENE